MPLDQADGGASVYIVGQSLDIASTKNFEEAFSRCQETLDNVQRIAGLGSWDSNLAEGVIGWSKEMNRLLGYPPGAAATSTIAPRVPVPPPYLAAIHPADIDAVQLIIESAVKTKEAFAIDHRIICPGGEERVVYARGEPVLGSTGEMLRLVGTLQDVTERKMTEEDLLRVRRQLRALSVHQGTLIEEERKHIAREVHDEMGQKLTALQIGLSVIATRYGATQGLAQGISDLQALVEDTIGIVRHISTRLRPPVLDLGLAAAIEWLAEDFRHRWEIDCLVDLPKGDIHFSEPIGLTLFRVVQESLTNVAKHAGANRVVISLFEDDGKISLSIRDNGQGFDPAVVREMSGFGLLGMRERVLALQGTLYIKSAIGQGTVVAIELPLRDSPL